MNAQTYLKQYIEKREMTQTEFADRVGYRKEVINRMLNGKAGNPIVFSFLGAFVRAFGNEDGRACMELFTIMWKEEQGK
jgi:transcriptional regulator with XRE-family HTH domain